MSKYFNTFDFLIYLFIHLKKFPYISNQVAIQKKVHSTYTQISDALCICNSDNLLNNITFSNNDIDIVTNLISYFKNSYEIGAFPKKYFGFYKKIYLLLQKDSVNSRDIYSLCSFFQIIYLLKETDINSDLSKWGRSLGEINETRTDSVLLVSKTLLYKNPYNIDIHEYIFKLVLNGNPYFLYWETSSSLDRNVGEIFILKYKIKSFYIFTSNKWFIKINFCRDLP